MSPELSGKKVTLKEIEPTDIPVLWKLIFGQENPEWKKWDAPYYPLKKKNLEEYISSLNTEGTYESIAKLGIWTKDHELIGTVGYYWEHKESNWLEMGISIYSADHWSAGYGRESLKLWITYLFENKPLVRVGLTTWSGNIRMIKCAERLGMKKEAQLRKCRLWNGIYYDALRYGILREEWQP